MVLENRPQTSKNIQMTKPTLLIAIPTYNRGHIVEKAIRSLSEQIETSDRWKVIVVNNNSTDDTLERLSIISRHWPKLSCITEYQQGSSNARNRAIRECQEDYILFTDDECIFPTDYITKALDIIDKQKPHLFGGPILPWYQEEKPLWFKDDYGSYSLPDMTGRARRISFSGANMGFSMTALSQVGKFDPDLGIHGSALGYGEETDLELRILKKFGTDSAYYSDDFFNRHLVLPAKYNWRKLIFSHFSRGMARAKMKKYQSNDTNEDEETIPHTLKPHPYQARELTDTKIYWQNIVYEKGLPIIRRIGYIYGLIINNLS
jgi:glycosyltransferase involved in cell wall biosynthesis